jgi:hypothetical protein
MLRRGTKNWTYTMLGNKHLANQQTPQTATPRSFNFPVTWVTPNSEREQWAAELYSVGLYKFFFKHVDLSLHTSIFVSTTIAICFWRTIWCQALFIVSFRFVFTPHFLFDFSGSLAVLHKSSRSHVHFDNPEIIWWKLQTAFEFGTPHERTRSLMIHQPVF